MGLRNAADLEAVVAHRAGSRARKRVVNQKLGAKRPGIARARVEGERDPALRVAALPRDERKRDVDRLFLLAPQVLEDAGVS